MKHTIKLLTLAFMLATILTLTGCPGPVNTVDVWDDGVVTTEPTCTTEGVKTYTCSNGETRTESIPALGHDFGNWTDWTVTNPATVDHEGTETRTRTCKRTGCNCSETETRFIPRLEDTTDNGDTEDETPVVDNGDEEETEGDETDNGSEETPIVNTHTHNYIAGGCDDPNCSEHYLYNGEDDYQISAYVYSSKEDAQNSENERVLYFSFPNDTTGISQIVIGNNGPKITIDNLIQMKNGYSGKTVKYFAYESNDFTTQIDDFEYENWSESLEDLDSGSPVYIVIE